MATAPSSTVSKIAQVLLLSQEGGEAQVLRRVKARIAGLRIGRTCGRCAGSGHYSRNYYGSTTCYACNGRTVLAPRTSAQWRSALVTASTMAQDGTLDRYLQELRGRKLRRVAMDRAMAAWTATGVSDRYQWSKVVQDRKAMEAGEATPAQVENVRVSALNDVCCRAYGAVSTLAHGYDTHGGTDDRPEAVRMAHLPLALERCEALAQAVSVLLDQDTTVLRDNPSTHTLRDGNGSWAVFIPNGESTLVVRGQDVQSLPVDVARQEWTALARDGWTRVK